MGTSKNRFEKRKCTEDGRWEGTHRQDTNIAATYKKIFEAIAVADEKPIALHCTHGADRTGIVSWFLLGLLGVSKEDCARDYVMTRFAGERAVLAVDDSSGKSEIAKWNAKTEALEGATWADKTYKHLNEDFGIEADTLETIREDGLETAVICLFHCAHGHFLLYSNSVKLKKLLCLRPCGR